jgi:hypothetical protein
MEALLIIQDEKIILADILIHYGCGHLSVLQYLQLTTHNKFTNKAKP